MLLQIPSNGYSSTSGLLDLTAAANVVRKDWRGCVVTIAVQLEERAGRLGNLVHSGGLRTSD